MKRAKNVWLVLPFVAVAWAFVAWAQSVPSFGDFVLFASDSLKAKGLVVSSGDLGANGRFRSTKQLDAPSSTIAAAAVQLHPKSSCDDLLANSAQSGPSCGPAIPVQTPIIADLAAACGAPSPFPTCGSEAVIVPHNGSRTLTPAAYGNLMVAGGGAGPGTVVLEPGSYTFCNIKIARNALLLARGPVQINVTGMIKFDNGSTVGPESTAVTPCQVRIFSSGSRVHISRKAHTSAILCAPNAELELTVGAVLQGAFFAREVDSDRVFLSAPGCAVSPTTTSTTTSTTTTTVAGATTTSSSSSSTSSSTSTSTTTTTGGSCGNGVVDQGEPCDPSSPTGALLCPEGQVCTAQCTCESTTTTSTSSSSSTSTSSSSTSTSTTSTSSTSTTGSSSTSSTTSSSTSTTTVTTTSSSSSSSSTSTSTSSSTTTSAAPTTSSTSTSTTTSTTSTTAGVPSPSFLDFTTGPAGGVCGQTFRTTDGSGAALKNLTCGGLDIGGGSSTVAEGPTPDGATSRFTTSCVGSSCTIGPTLADGTGFKCTNTGCVFGTPLPIPNAGTTTCVQNVFSAPASGTMDISTGVGQVNVPLTSISVVTGNATQPCPICRIGSTAGAACVGTPAAPCTGVCEGSPNQGAACTSTNSQGLTNDCPAPASSAAGNRCYKGTNNNGACTSNAACPGGVCAIFVGNIPVNLAPLTTDVSVLSDAGGLFCQQRHCVGGTNYGNVCTVDTDCPGTTAAGRCAGQATAQVGAFLTNVCQAGANSGRACTTAADCPGSTCRAGSANNMCSGGANVGLGCATNTDCPGSTCVRAGTLARRIQAQGAPAGSLLPIATSHAVTLAASFCIPAANTDPNGAGAGFLINGAANLPGPGATSLPGTMRLVP